MLKPFTLLCFVVLIASTLAAQSPRIVGYLPYYRFASADLIAFEKLTHLCLAFANPDMSGNLDIGGRNIAPIVAKARPHGVDVLISVAGGYLDPAWAAAWKHLMRPENRSGYIHKIIEYVHTYDLQGVDVDLEWQYVDSLYSGFVMELSDSLRASGKLMTAALPGTYRYPQISQAALQRFDFINMMVYDEKGPWNPGDAGQHSSYAFAQRSIEYWRDRQGVPADKLTLGVPFYGYDFTDSGNVRSVMYRSMVDLDPANAQLDQVGQIWYNGIPTIELKTELALREVSGIMIWELGQDAFNEYSLLDAIFQKTRLITSSPLVYDQTWISAFPNPFSDVLTITPNLKVSLEVQLFDLQGRLIWSAKGAEIFDGSALQSGLYVLKATDGQRTTSMKIMKV